MYEVVAKSTNSAEGDYRDWAGILLWRRSPWGYLLASISLTQGLMMSITLPALIVVPLIQEGKTTLGEAIPFSLMSLMRLVLVGVFYQCVQEKQAEPVRNVSPVLMPVTEQS